MAEKSEKQLVVGILAHVDSGKTTLSEAMLYRAGSIRKLGRVDNKDAFLDTDTLEKARGITIFSKQALLKTGSTNITLLDTPGHVDFSTETERTLQVLDYAVLVISGTDGVQSHTETLWRLLRRYHIPTFVFINKMDLPGPGKEALLSQLSHRLGDGFVDFGAEQAERDEALALCDERLMEKMLDAGSLTAEDIIPAVARRHVFPCWFGVALHKSLSMVFFSGKIVHSLDNPTIVVLTDRNDLDDQLFDTFAACAQLLGQEPKQADDREQLKRLLKVASGGIVFSTMQKFMPEEGNVYDLLSERRNIVVITDEAHRTQYGFKAREINVKDSEGKVIGKKTVYGLGKYLRDALPNATYLGFTGTPIEKTDANTRAVFGDYIDVYDIARAVDDHATVPIFYESRMARVDLPEEGKRLIAEVDEELEKDDAEQAEKARNKRARLEALIGSEKRLANIAQDIVAHFEARQNVFSGKGLIVCMSRPIAAALYEHIIALRPTWHADDLKKGVIKVVMTANSADGPALTKFHTTKGQRKTLAERMKDPADPLQLVIVCDMWLTGFDVPCLLPDAHSQNIQRIAH